MNLIYRLELPVIVRIWRWWCRYGFKRGNGNTLGGSFALRMIRKLYRLRNNKSLPEGSLVLTNRLVLHVDSFDLRTYQKIIPELSTHDPEIRLATCITKPGGVYLDIGANAGVHSLFALSGGASTVHSFEPNPSMICIMKRSLEANNLTSNWNIYPIGLGDQPRQKRLHIDQNFSGTASLHSNWQGGTSDSQLVPVETLDNWASSRALGEVDVIKIDVEGWEQQVITGGSSTIKKHQPYICFEYNSPSMMSSGINPLDVLKTLEELGYELLINIGELPKLHQMTCEDLMRLKDIRLNLLSIPANRERDFNTRVLGALKTLSEA